MNLIQDTIYLPPIKHLLGFAANNVLYPIAEKLEKRNITPKVHALKHFHSLSRCDQRKAEHAALVEMLSFSQANVPYYKDLFKQHHIDIQKIERDSKYMMDIPYLTKMDIREHGTRLLSQDLSMIKFHQCKTGGSTGPSCFIYYDQQAADCSAAVTRYARSIIGKKIHRSELHFACDFQEKNQHKFWQRETLKSAAMNRSNVFFQDVNKTTLEEIYQKLKTRRPYIVHGHPSTLYLLASYINEERHNAQNLFTIFEPSGEYCSPKMKALISSVFGCSVHNRYGLAEFGVTAYQFNCKNEKMRVFSSEVWCETYAHNEGQELIFTGLKNKLMPLIRYQSGDLVEDVFEEEDGQYLTGLLGRIHDKITIGTNTYLTHTIQDIFDHRVKGIVEFQIISKGRKIDLLLKIENAYDAERITHKINQYFPDISSISFIGDAEFHRVGRHQKFRHLVSL